MSLTTFLILCLAVYVIQAAEKNIVCYYGTWAAYRNGAGKFTVEDIDPFLCTHLIYAFVGININGTIAVLDPWLDLEDNWGLGTMQRFNKLKNINNNLKTLVAVGGWNEGSRKFSIVAQSATLRTRFAKEVVEFCKIHGFDGLDVDWEYPGQRDGDPIIDRENFVYFLEDLRKELSKHGLLLTAAVAATETSAAISYNIQEISKYLDFINLMTYDMHGPWDTTTGHNAPLYAGPNDVTSLQQQLNLNSSLSYWLQSGAPAGKLNLGVPFYGRSFTLRTVTEHGVGAPSSGPGQGGHYTYESGFLGYNEVCEKLLFEKWNYCWDNQQHVPFAYSGNQWVGYDDAESIRIKGDFIIQHDLAGGMIWSIETDDFNGKCGTKNVLLYTLKDSLNNVDTTTTSEFTTTSSGGSSETITNANATYTVTETDVPNTSASTTSLQTSTDESESFQCINSGFYRDPINCAKFYYCLQTKRHDFECSEGLYFDPVILSCNWKHAVDC